MKKKKNIIIYIILSLAIIFGLYRVYPYFENNIPLGYDPGLYRLFFLDYAKNLPDIVFSNMSDRTKLAYPPFLGFLGNILKIIGFDIDNLLSFGLGFFSIITSVFIYLNLKKYSKITAIFGIIIFSISIIQYQAFWWNYYKQIIGIIFLLSSLYLLENKKYFLSFPVIIALFTIHRPSGVFFLLMFIIYKIVNYLIKKDKNYLGTPGWYKDISIVFLAGIISILIYIPLFQEQILELLKPLFTTSDSSGKSGTFFLKEEFGIYNIFIILASLYGLYIKLNKKKFDYITVGYITGMTWVGFGLLFYNRFYIFFDIFIILIAAYGFGQLYKNKKKIFYIIFPIFFILQSLYYLDYINKNNTPLISKIEFENIKEINTIVPENSTIMVTSKNYSPRIAGYTYKPTIAPGLFDLNPWNLNIWKIWWKGNGKIKCIMLKEIKKDHNNLYLWIGERQYKENLDGGKCFKKVITGKGFSLFEIKYENEK